MADQRPDPAGIFASDLHRRVAAHLDVDEEGTGWDVVTLLYRLAEDHATAIPPVDDHGLPDFQAGLKTLEATLADLKKDRLAMKDGDAWALTSDGFEALTGPIANEPPADAEPIGPAIIDLGPIPLGGKAAAHAGVKS